MWITVCPPGKYVSCCGSVVAHFGIKSSYQSWQTNLKRKRTGIMGTTIFKDNSHLKEIEVICWWMRSLLVQLLIGWYLNAPHLSRPWSSSCIKTSNQWWVRIKKIQRKARIKKILSKKQNPDMDLLKKSHMETKIGDQDKTQKVLQDEMANQALTSQPKSNGK